DWMPRNLNRSIEVAWPVYVDDIREDLKEMLKIKLRDNTKPRILDPELQNLYNKQNLEATFRAHEDYYKYIKHNHHIVMKIYHNPRCAKSRAGLKYLEEKGYDLEIVKYMNDSLSENELKEVISKTGKKPMEFVRTQENEFKENYKDKELSDDEWIKALVENPKL